MKTDQFINSLSFVRKPSFSFTTNLVTSHQNQCNQHLWPEKNAISQSSFLFRPSDHDGMISSLQNLFPDLIQVERLDSNFRYGRNLLQNYVCRMLNMIIIDSWFVFIGN